MNVWTGTVRLCRFDYRKNLESVLVSEMKKQIGVQLLTLRG